MYAHIDGAKKRMTLISIPRDLYYNNRKINSVYHYFGIKELQRQLSNITGYPIHKYILIDMYAFIDVIDTIGGVDITLEENVIDPTYKTYDNGKWSTLYYKLGTYHFSGKQALRIARSRHYSSDFSRAKRQQLILEALRKKALSLTITDANTIAGIIQSVLKHTETDVSPQEAVTYFFRFKDFDIKRGYVLSTGNILTSSRTNDAKRATAAKNCSVIGDQQQKKACLQNIKTMNKGQYILSPKNSNWKLIPWFFRKIFEE